MIQRLINEFLFFKEYDLIQKVKQQDAQIEKIEELNHQIMFERLSVDVEYFRLMAMKQQNKEAKSLFDRVAIAANVFRHWVLGRFGLGWLG